MLPISTYTLGEFYLSHPVYFQILPMQISARDIKVVRPMYGVELFDGETARFEVEISEDDIHGQWKLNGEPLTTSPVRFGSKNVNHLTICK